MGGLPANRTVNGVAVDADNPKVMYVAMRDGLFKSADAGETWKPVGKDLRNLAAVAVNAFFQFPLHLPQVLVPALVLAGMIGR